MSIDCDLTFLLLKKLVSDRCLESSCRRPIDTSSKSFTSTEVCDLWSRFAVAENSWTNFWTSSDYVSRYYLLTYFACVVSMFDALLELLDGRRDREVSTWSTDIWCMRSNKSWTTLKQFWTSRWVALSLSSFSTLLESAFELITFSSSSAWKNLWNWRLTFS